MKHLSPIVIACLLPACLLLGLRAPDATAPTPPRTISNDSTDILAAVIALQDHMPAPQTQFRPGHVNPKNIKLSPQKTATGYHIALPAHSLTPSPTIYKGIAYVSGGFGSKEFYAFDAQSGEMKWAIDLDDDGPSSAVIEDDIVVFNTESCTIFACNAFTGEMLWSLYLGDPLMSTPSISEGIVYTAYPAAGRGSFLPNNPYNQIQQKVEGIPPHTAPQSKEKDKSAKPMLRGSHVFIALDLKTGKILWQKWIDGDIMSAPVVEQDEVYATTFPGTFYKFQAKTGEILAANASRATSAPSIVDKQIYMSQRSDKEGPANEQISAFSAQSPGKQRSFYSKNAPYLDEAVQSRSELKSQAAHYDAGNGFGAGAPANSGWKAASANIGQSNVSSLQAFQGSRVLHIAGKNYASMGDELVCTDVATGEVAWKSSIKGNLGKSGGFLATPPLEVNNTLIYATLSGDIILADPNSGKEIKRYSIGENIRYQPVVEGGNIYVSSVSGKLHCIQTGDSRLTGWPTWGANSAHTNKPLQ